MFKTNKDEMEAIWEKADKSRAAKTADKPVPAAPSPAAPKAAVEPSKATTVSFAAMHLAGRAVVSSLLLTEWQPKNIRRLNPTEESCVSTIDKLSASHDAEYDNLVIKDEPCWDEAQKRDANLRLLVSYLGGESGLELSGANADDEGVSAASMRATQLALCNGHAGHAKETCTMLFRGSTNVGPLTDPLPRREALFIRKTAADLRYCADAIVDVNATSVRTLAKKFEVQLQAAAIALSKNSNIALVLSKEVDAFRRQQKLVMPTGKTYAKLPAICSTPK